MRQRSQKTVLFLCTGNYYRSRFAEILFNSVAARMGLPWRASSRGLALERGLGNVGPMALAAAKALEKLGLRSGEDWSRMPSQVTAEDLESADRIVALKRLEHLPLLQERFPDRADKVEFWHVEDEDTPEVRALIEHEVMGLAARLIGGGQREETTAAQAALEKACRACGQPTTACVCQARSEKVKAAVVRVGRETKGRRGKGVTTVNDLPLDEAGLWELAAVLKQRCGTGGTVKDGRIEIQGDQRDRLVSGLEEMGYRVKRCGG